MKASLWCDGQGEHLALFTRNRAGNQAALGAVRHIDVIGREVADHLIECELINYIATRNVGHARFIIGDHNRRHHDGTRRTRVTHQCVVLRLAHHIRCDEGVNPNAAQCCQGSAFGHQISSRCVDGDGVGTVESHTLGLCCRCIRQTHIQCAGFDQLAAARCSSNGCGRVCKRIHDHEGLDGCAS